MFYGVALGVVGSHSRGGYCCDVLFFVGGDVELVGQGGGSSYTVRVEGFKDTAVGALLEGLGGTLVAEGARQDVCHLRLTNYNCFNNKT